MTDLDLDDDLHLPDLDDDLDDTWAAVLAMIVCLIALILVWAPL